MKEAPLTRATPSFLASLSLSSHGCPLHIIARQLSNINNELKMNYGADVEAKASARHVMYMHQHRFGVRSRPGSL